MMGDILKAIGIGLLVVALIFVWAILGALIGAFSGWIVGMTPLGTWIIETFASVKIFLPSTVHLGTTLGFIGGLLGGSLCKGGLFNLSYTKNTNRVG